MGRSEIRRGRGASALVLGLACLATACGGGGGSAPTPTPTPTNRSPTFSSAATASVIENSTAAFYTPVASDPDSDALTIAIAGGPDSSAFALTGGALTFAGPRNFDLPTDANGDNVYQVTLSASDGRGGTATLDLSVTVTNSREGIAVRRVATGLTGAVAMAADESGSALLIGEANGTVFRIDGATGQRQALLNAPGPFVNGQRLLGLTRRAGTGVYAGIFRVYRRTDNSVAVDRGSDVIGLADAGSAAPHAAIVQSRLGEILVAVGDPSGSSAQIEGSGLGKLWRIDNVADPYAGASPRFFTLALVGKGIREPGGMGVIGGVVAFSDRGATRADEISEFFGSPIVNYGWPFVEGQETVGIGAPAGLLRPIFAMPLGTGARESGGIVGPVQYAGPIQSLSNHILLADRDGSIWSYSRDAYAQVTQVGPDRLELRSEDFRPDAGTIGAPVAIAQDAQGTIYILDGDGELFRLEAG